MLTDTTVSIEAPAKLNLGLRIEEQREDGFHNIETIFQTVSLTDTLEISFRNDLIKDKLRIEGPEQFPVESDNLVFQALETVRDHGVSLPCADINLEKRIPPGAGLGGGSSDAASMLHAVQEVMDGSIARKELRTIARELGADVPFFLHGGTMRGEGIGDNLSMMDDFEAHVILAVPDEGITTEWAYEKFSDYLSQNRSYNTINDDLKWNNIEHNWEALEFENDFEPLLLNTIDSHRDLIDQVERHTDFCGVSGSGSALYGLFRSQKKALDVSNKLENRYPEVKFFHEQFVQSNRIPWFR